MKIFFGAGKKGWVEYVLYGTKRHPRNQNKIEIVDGNLALTRDIYSSTKYKQNYIRGVLAFQGKPDPDVMKKVYEEFKELFMYGYESDEYNIAAVAHYDTDNYHIHFCIPKLNLITGRQNQIYLDKADRERVNLIRDYLIAKYELKVEINKSLTEIEKEEKELKRIEIWREKHKQKLPNLSRKRNKIKIQTEIENHIRELISLGLVTNLDETKRAIEEIGYKVVNQGHDINGNFDYVTIQDDSGTKMRLKGEIYGSAFYTRETTTEVEAPSRDEEIDIDDIKDKLTKANERRKQFIQKRYSARAKKLNTVFSSVDLNNEGVENDDTSRSITSVEGENEDFTGGGDTRVRELCQTSRRELFEIQHSIGGRIQGFAKSISEFIESIQELARTIQELAGTIKQKVEIQKEKQTKQRVKDYSVELG